MVRYDFTRRALGDLQSIARYTGNTWGQSQAQLYREELELGVQKLALSPSIDRRREEVGPSVRSFPIARHVVFYVESEGGITVLRVLHPKLDVPRAFSDDGSQAAPGARHRGSG